MKKIIIIVILVIILPIAWYLISPIFIVIERNDKLPFVEETETQIMGEQELEEVVDLIGEDNIEENMEKRDIEEEKKEVLINSYKGDFIAAEHEVKGDAKIIESAGKKILRFENFETINGPDLFIYLGADLEAKDFIDLGRVKGTKGNINYNIENDIDFDKYKYVMVWCKPFGALFSYAELEKNK